MLMTAQVGLAILDPELKPVFCNAEAYSILTYSAPGKDPHNAEQLAMQEIETLARLTTNGSLHEYLSGRRRYLVRMIPSAGQEAGPPTGVLNRYGPRTVLLMERTSHNNSERIDRISRQYDLTGREQQAISLLCHGLTSKQIAQRMNISPNTVKVFLRLVMLKMNVSTRSAIVGKLVDSSISPNL
jgi:DNA-binding NarL/FixJ family response regulator